MEVELMDSKNGFASRRRFTARRLTARRSCAHEPQRRSEQGFSVVEVLIAAALLLLITIGVLPMFTKSITNNLEGRKSTEATNQARSEVERLYQLTFNHPDLAVPAGQTESMREELFSEQQQQWIDIGSWNASDSEVYRRIVRVRQYGVDALLDQQLDPTEALNGSTPATLVHFKEIEVEVRTAGQLGVNRKTVTLRMYKSV